MREFLQKLLKFDDDLLHGSALEAGRQLGSTKWWLAALLRTVSRTRLYRKHGCKSIHLYAEKFMGLTRRETNRLLRVATVAEKYSLLSEAFRLGQICWSRFREVSRVIQPDTEAHWVRFAKKYSTRHVEKAVAKSPRAHRQSKTPPPPIEPTFWDAPTPEVIHKLTHVGQSNLMDSTEGQTHSTDGATRQPPPVDPHSPTGQTDSTDCATEQPTHVGPHAPTAQPPMVTETTGFRQASDSPNEPDSFEDDDAPPSSLVRVTLVLTPEQYAIFEAAERKVKGKLRRRSNREEVVTEMAKQVLDTKDSRSRARYPVVIQLHQDTGRATFSTDIGELPVAAEDVELLQGIATVVPAATVGLEPEVEDDPFESWLREEQAAAAAREGGTQPDNRAGDPADAGVSHREQPPPQVGYAVTPRTTLSAAVLRQALASTGWRCKECGSRDFLELDHEVALAHGGRNEAHNVAPVCRSCHREKHRADFAADPCFIVGRSVAMAARAAMTGGAGTG